MGHQPAPVLMPTASIPDFVISKPRRRRLWLHLSPSGIMQVTATVTRPDGALRVLSVIIAKRSGQVMALTETARMAAQATLIAIIAMEANQNHVIQP